MHQLRPSRRQLLQGAGGPLITFTLAPLLERGGQAQEGAATPQSGMIRMPVDQTSEAVETRNVTGDRVDSWLSIDKDGNVTIYAGKEVVAR